MVVGCASPAWRMCPARMHASARTDRGVTRLAGRFADALGHCVQRRAAGQHLPVHKGPVRHAMPAFICETCGSQFSPSDRPPSDCPICEDERQFVLPSGQRWTTLEQLLPRHVNCYRQYEPGLLGIGTVPHFGIGQRALLVRTPSGNVLWDCIALIDPATIEIIKALGGLIGIAISHPHYYTTMVEWSRAFGDVPIHLHAGDQQWIMRKDPAVKLWDGDTLRIADGATLIRCGGHFAGGTVLHWAAGAGGRGALLVGDIIQVVAHRKFVTFMRSYPNMVPLSVPAVQRIGAMLEPFQYEVIHGAWFDRSPVHDAKAAVKRSIDRYLAAIRGDGTAELQ
jgi:hypothetical protein